MPAESWGRYPRYRAAREHAITDRFGPLPQPSGRSMLAHGMGRSYGDVALNDGGVLLLTTGLDRFISFDAVSGVLRAESGVTLDQILALTVPAGWFLPVTPGTRFVTLGGAVANDVHGKNHHAAGTFGCHVRALELVRSDGSRFECRPDLRADWFAATVGGLGLTGLITWVEIRLQPIRTPFVSRVDYRFGTLEEYWELDVELGARYPNTVAWVDCLSGGRGIYTAGEFAAEPPDRAVPGNRTFSVPFAPPISLINALSLRAFNGLYYHRPIPAQSICHYAPFFYPLDKIEHWNRIYGRRGFLQYQCVIPRRAMADGAQALFDCLGRRGQGSFLAVLKTFGDRPSPGMLAFARPGVTLALDFPYHGARTDALFAELDAIVAEAGGTLYPAKDARMSASMFANGYPMLNAFTRFMDPAFSSSFWRRVMP